jgi:FtsH-binding integral membrane protein
LDSLYLHFSRNGISLAWDLCKYIFFFFSGRIELNSGVFFYHSLYAGIWILVIAGLVQMFFPFSKGIQLALAVGGVIIFSGYILFDTYLIFNKYSPEDYIIASISLYLDVINLFLRILEILELTSNDN